VPAECTSTAWNAFGHARRRAISPCSEENRAAGNGYNERVFLRRCYRSHQGRRYAYWALVESYRTARGSRQRVVSYLGNLDEPLRRSVLLAAGGADFAAQLPLPGVAPAPTTEAEWVEVDVKRVRVEHSRAFGGAWLALQVAERLGLPAFLRQEVFTGCEESPWPLMALVLVLGRLCEPGSELSLAEAGYERTALSELLGVPAAKVSDDRLYRALDRLLPSKKALEKQLKTRLGELFDLQYDLLLYDVTSTFFEGQAEQNPLAQRGYSRDGRADCKQVCIALVVSREGIPLGYEVFAGNRTDVTTVEEIVEKIEAQYGSAERIWVMDRGMISEENLEFLRAKQRRYIVGTPKGQLRRFEAELVGQGWSEVHPGLEVQLCPAPDGAETFILCRSAERREKERAMHERAAERLETGLRALAAACAKRTPGTRTVAQVERRVGRLLEKSTRAARLFQVEVRAAEPPTQEGAVMVTWQRHEVWSEWATLSEGCYLLRTNVPGWTAAELWQAYIQLTEAEAAFRIQKSDLALRPIWHQKEERVQAHILVCFLGYVIWKTLGKMCQAAGLGDCPRKVFDTLSQLRTVDVVLPTRQGVEIRRRCVERPDAHQAILLQRLGLHLPESLPITDL
jgi:DDE family transposase